MKEQITKLIDIKEWLIKKIDGNYAQQKNQIEIYKPFIDKIDEMILALSKLIEEN